MKFWPQTGLMKFISLLTLMTMMLVAESGPWTVHGFRSPSIGLERRFGAVGLHGGLYPTILKPAEGAPRENVFFAKTGAAVYYAPFRIRGENKSEVFSSVSYVGGLNRGWGNGVQYEQGVRLAITERLELRLGVSVLKAGDRPRQINPTIGFGWNFKR